MEYQKVGALTVDVAEYDAGAIEALGSGDVKKGAANRDLSKGESSIFEQRESQDIAWSDMHFVVNNEKKILSNVWGSARGGEVCAILGYVHRILPQ
jgi:co-chaperonin GroES (HSP10)